MMVRRRDSSLGGTTRSPPASPSLPVILSNSCRFCDIRRNNAPGWLKLLGIADADSTSMSRRVHSSLEQFFDKARKSGSHLTLRWRKVDSKRRSRAMARSGPRCITRYPAGYAARGQVPRLTALPLLGGTI